MSTTATDEIVRHATSDTPEESAHIVMVPIGEPDKTPQAYVLRARIEGFPIVPLCGHVFVPQKNPEPLPVCAGCLEVYEQPGEHRESRNELPFA